jgi:ribose-phosphate pyrophosphokinase
MTPVVLAMPGNELLANQLATRLALERVAAQVRRFPDGESYVRVEDSIEGRQALIVCTLDRPDEKLIPLLLLACAARDAGATKIGLVAPYLAYMRQDMCFNPGETVSVKHFSSWICGHFDWLITVDPHLHRVTDLGQVYHFPTRVVHAADGVARWLHTNVQRPLLVGPDEESAQWVDDVAARTSAPFIVLKKTRRGDRNVEISVPDVERWQSHTPVLVDDIVSTARTMIETVHHLKRAGLAAPVCIAVHAVFAQNAFDDLRASGVADIVSCDTIKHSSNRIELGSDIANAVRELGVLQ